MITFGYLPKSSNTKGWARCMLLVSQGDGMQIST